MPVRVVGPWSIEVGPGTIDVKGRTITLPQATRLDVPPSEVFHMKDEKQAKLPVFDKNHSWHKGNPLGALVAENCAATGLHFADTVRLKPGSGDAKPYERGKDFEVDPFWAYFGRIEGGAITAEQEVFLDYDYSLNRLDSVLVDKNDALRLALGTPAPALALPPQPGEGEIAIVNVWVPGRTEKLTDENLYPIEFREMPTPKSQEDLVPKTLAKLRAGQPVTIVAWGDSVTEGGAAVGHPDNQYQHQFAAMLRERFPKSEITMLTAAWGGMGSKAYLEAPAGGAHDFVRDVLDPKPDLVTIEFVNDAYLGEADMIPHYAPIIDRLRGNGSEVILIAPHFVRPDWMGADGVKVQDDPRPYVKMIRIFGERAKVAVADASEDWGRLWRQGIPYITLFANGINHPDVRGHTIFAKRLLAVFPEK